ncbi:MAG: hypothetical protein ACRDHN_17925 [Thermomicrobiales bacterium]
MAGSNPVAFGANATSINFGNSFSTSSRPAEREYAREARPQPVTKTAPLPDWDRFWGELPVAPTHEDRDASRS